MLNKKGFTLIELMVVVGIIGILSAIAIPNYISYRAKGLSVVAKAEAKVFYTSALAYFADVAGDGNLTRGTSVIPGYGENPDIESSCNIKITAATGVITIEPAFGTFYHKKGGDTYALGADGAITLVN